ncbi:MULTISPECIES: recombination regulator RecX [unclassified Streptococcus]|uniref:recombination regulator RecX n=1 Tax=unclassified Streptococcus TaxID=2608887 RepID=UPI00107259EE|nr:MULTISPECIES: recombination regulator RecX [unclassified Streptococcus]MBF0787333.1 recombination regulator RecX [Streptococcus sp. 19428wC2_LYSM12]MCQ9211128.1 recombination regulator RecX [Streptococcus sp. B01]MCQ9214403.1 recombination regulator RecX [Streptococcus sp. O1]TFV05681.1 recombination regulator RecX [Streptococcus sp. LYSM12]
MKITKLEKKKRLYLLELDSNKQLYITEDTIVRFMLSKDKDITPETLIEIQSFAQLSYGKNLALYHLSFKQRTRKEVQRYLEKYEIEPTIIPHILNNLEADNWINDQKYVETFLHQNQLSGDKGPQALKQKLSQKGISISLIEEELQKLDFLPIAERLSQKLAKIHAHKLPPRALQDKLLQSLLNKGFSYPQAQTAIKNLDLKSDDELEEQLIQKELAKQYRKYSRKYDGYELQQRLFQALLRKGYDSQQITSTLRDYL